MKNIITIIFLSVLFVAPAYTQTIGLQSLDEQDFGMTIGYNQKELEEWLGRENMTSYTLRFGIDYALTDDIKFSLLPSLSLINEKLGSSTHISPGFYLKYTGIHYIARSFGYFYRGGIGLTYENSDFDAVKLDTDFRESINTEFQMGGGFFGDLDLPYIEIRIFGGGFVTNTWKNQIIDLAKSHSHHPKLLGELGIDVKISRNQSFFVMVSSPSTELDLSYYFAFKIY